jgi:hypothetical protein
MSYCGFEKSLQSFGDYENPKVSYLYKLPLNEKLLGQWSASSPGTKSSVRAMINDCEADPSSHDVS